MQSAAVTAFSSQRLRTDRYMTPRTEPVTLRQTSSFNSTPPLKPALSIPAASLSARTTSLRLATIQLSTDASLETFIISTIATGPLSARLSPSLPCRVVQTTPHLRSPTARLSVLALFRLLSSPLCQTASRRLSPPRSLFRSVRSAMVRSSR